ncbi:GrpB family protein [Natronospora cellulosivora (SeqCode)]
METVTEKIAAYIVRETDGNSDELLMFSFKNLPVLSLQIPCGSFLKEENIFYALKREIYNETGLDSFKVVKKLGEREKYHDNINKIVKRHYFLLKVTQETDDKWEHEVNVKGLSSGIVLKYNWYKSEELLLLNNEFHHYLSKKHIPSLFNEKAIFGLENKKISIMPHMELWREKFEKEKSLISRKLNNKVLIEHIGSTAIPGMPAKPIIDIGIGTSKKVNKEELIKSLEELSYIYKGENGITGRDYFVKESSNKRYFHIHMYDQSHPTWSDHLLFRNYLIENADVARAYGNLKLDIWRNHRNNRTMYTELKKDFIQNILHEAKKV